MKAPGYLLYGASVVLAAAIPYLHVSEQVYGPRQDRLESRLQASMAELDQRQAALRERSRELSSELDESSARASELRQRTGALGETLLRERAALESRLTEVESLREQRRSLEQRLGEATSTAETRRQQLEEVRSRRDRLQEEIRALRGQLEGTEAEQSLIASDADRLAMERGVWEKRESVEGLPRAAAQGLVDWADERLCTGLELDLWLLRPWSQRLGLRGAYLADHDGGQELGYLGLGWQKLLSRTSHLDLWAGPHFYSRRQRDHSPVDPAVGARLGFTVPRFRLGLGLEGMLAPDRTLVGLSLGWSQIGEEIDVYGR